MYRAMAGGPTPLADTDPAEGQVKIVKNDGYVLASNGEVAQQALDRLAAPVHVGLGLGEDDEAVLALGPADRGVALLARERRAEPAGELVDYAKPDVVPGFAVGRSGIAEP